MTTHFQRNVTVVIVLTILCFLGLYLYIFSGGLSKDSTSWSNFGNYMNGVLTPVLTAINIYVFIKLTVVISNLEDKRTSNAIEKENERFEKEMQHERELLLMQMKKQELDTFVKQTNRIFDYTSKENRIDILKQVADYLKSFQNNGFKRFEIKDNKANRKINRLWVKLNILISNIENNKETEEETYNI